MLKNSVKIGHAVPLRDMLADRQTDRQTDTYSVPHMHIGMLIAILCSTTTPGAE